VVLVEIEVSTSRRWPRRRIRAKPVRAVLHPRCGPEAWIIDRSFGSGFLTAKSENAAVTSRQGDAADSQQSFVSLNPECAAKGWMDSEAGIATFEGEK
jgi:hypothetical protein